MPRSRYIQHPETLELVLADEYVPPSPKGPKIINDIEPFVSPVDGSLISSRSSLRLHNKRHRVVHLDEWGNQGEINRREAEKVFKPGNPERIETIRRAIAENGGDY